MLCVDFFRPTHLRIVVCRRKTKYRSDLLAWEPSLKCISTGSIVWHHPFECIIAITPPIKDVSTGTLRHKDVTIALQNVARHTKQNSTKTGKTNSKTLAKLRLNLADYYDAAGPKKDDKCDDPTNVNRKPISFKLKLRPESSKIISASINISIQRTDFNPIALLPIQQESPKKDEDEDVVSAVKINSNVSSTIPGLSLLGPNRLSSDIDSEASVGQLSQSNSSIDSLKIPSPLGNEPQPANVNSLQSSPHTTNSSSKISSLKQADSVQKGIPLTILPPPLPLRDWQKSRDPKSFTTQLTASSCMQQDLTKPPKTNVISNAEITEEITVAAANQHRHDTLKYEPLCEYQHATNPTTSPKHADCIAVTIIPPGKNSASSCII